MMKDRKISFLCELPPPFGGVTVKNQLLMDNVYSEIANINVVDFGIIRKTLLNTIPIFLKMSAAFLRHDYIIYGFGSYKRLNTAISIQRIVGGEKSFCNTINFVMGGNIKKIERNRRLIKKLKKIKTNLVETDGMQ